MHTKADWLLLFEKVREAGDDAESAYLVRTRLRRALLGSVRLATTHAGVEGPDLPGTYSLPAGVSPLAAKVLDRYNRLYERTVRLCQPSEAFDARWRQGWGTCLRDLDELEHALSELDAGGAA